MNRKFVAAVSLIFFLSTPVFAETEEVSLPRLPYKELIFRPGELLSSHSPSIVELPGGELFAVWYAATPESPYSVIWTSRKPVGAHRWTTPSIIHRTPGYANKNPVLYLGQDKKLWLFWADEKRLFKWTVDTLQAKVSDDLGHTWSDAHRIRTPIGFLPRNHPIRLHDGRVIFPLYVNWSTSSVIITSKDDGLTWDRPGYILFFFGIQPTIIQRSDLSLFALTRTGMWPRLSWQAVSHDLGHTWKDQRISNVKNPGTSLEMVKLNNGNIVMAFNDSKTDLSSLSLALSYDEGKTWPCVRVIEYTPGRINTYPSIAQDSRGLIHVVYSYDGRKSIAHFVTDQQWIEGKSGQPRKTPSYRIP